MLSQVVYKTNADYTGSYEAMTKNPLVIAEPTQKGLLTFWFKGSRTIFLLSPMGKLQVRWSDLAEKKMLFKLVRNLLVAKDNEKLSLQPTKQQTWIEYPVPESFKLYWCDSATEFVSKATAETKTSEQIDQPGTVNSSSADASNCGCEQQKYEVKPSDVKRSLEELRCEFKFFREPTFNEVALRSGCTHLRTLRAGLSLGFWEKQSSEEAEWIAERAINLAGWLKIQENVELNHRLIAMAKRATDNASLKVVQRAQDILKNCPDFAAEISDRGPRWSHETKTKWVQVFSCAPPMSRFQRELAEASRRLINDPETLSLLAKIKPAPVSFPKKEVEEKK